MKLPPKYKTGLSKKLKKVIAAPASFAFYVAIHDLVEYIETNAASGALKLPFKYGQLKQVHQGVKDVRSPADHDIGHERYMMIRSLDKIQKSDFSDSNPIWKKRELLRGCAKEIYEAISDAPDNSDLGKIKLV